MKVHAPPCGCSNGLARSALVHSLGLFYVLGHSLAADVLAGAEKEAQDHARKPSQHNHVEGQQTNAGVLAVRVDLKDEERIVEEEGSDEEGGDPALHVAPVLPLDVAHLDEEPGEETVAERKGGEHHQEGEDLEGDLPPHGPVGKIRVDVDHVGL